MFWLMIRREGTGFLLKICWSIESKQKSEIADSVSLLTCCSAIFDLYLAKAKQREVAKRIRAGLDVMPMEAAG